MTGTRRFGFEGYFEDFTVGETYRHARGKTITNLDNVLITNMVLNTAEPHFNEDAARKEPMFGKIIVYGGITVSMVLGLAAQDTAAQAVREIGLDKVRLFAPVFHGDSLYAYSTVLEAVPDAGVPGGIVTFLHRGFNQDDVMVFSGERRVLLRSRPA